MKALPRSLWTLERETYSTVTRRRPAKLGCGGKHRESPIKFWRIFKN